MKKCTSFYRLFLLIAFYHLSAVQAVVSSPSLTEEASSTNLPISKLKKVLHGYAQLSLPKETFFMIIRFALPKNLYEENLTDFDFRGCQFSDINLTGAILKNVILTHTVCDYRSLFQNNFNDRCGYLSNRCIVS